MALRASGTPRVRYSARQVPTKSGYSIAAPRVSYYLSVPAPLPPSPLSPVTKSACHPLSETVKEYVLLRHLPSVSLVRYSPAFGARPPALCSTYPPRAPAIPRPSVRRLPSICPASSCIILPPSLLPLPRVRYSARQLLSLRDGGIRGERLRASGTSCVKYLPREDVGQCRIAAPRVRYSARQVPTRSLDSGSARQVLSIYFPPPPPS